MKNNIICNYAVIRFRPYPETEEFVNIGIVLACAKLGFLDFKIEARKHKRITDFFPELDCAIFHAAKNNIKNELNRLKCVNDNQHEFSFTADKYKQLFFEITKFKEGLFIFSNVKTILTENPGAELKNLFNYYVERQFLTATEHYETQMRKRLTKIFRANKIIELYKEEKIGDDKYHITIPFVHKNKNICSKAIKPVNFALKETTKIYEAGDKWKNRIQRLQNMNCMPEEMLLVIKEPEQAKKDVFFEVRDEIIKCGVKIVDNNNQDKIIEFAKIT
jgi:hypothetical protein